MKHGNQFGAAQTLYDWCVENNRMDINDRFDEELNHCTSKDVGFTSRGKFYFKCPRNLHGSELRYIKVATRNIQNGFVCTKCNSLAQKVIDDFGEEYLWSHWSDKNNMSPWDIEKASQKKVIIQCDKKDYHTYEQAANSFAKGFGCPYCINRKVHKLDSIGTIIPDIIDRWSDKNNKSPFEYAVHSESKVWLKCPNGIHDDYLQRLSNASTYNYRCPQCAREESMSKPNDLTGHQFGHLTAIKIDNESKQSITKKGNVRIRWWCKCDCGNPSLKSVLACHLTSEKIRSCGCLSPNISILSEKVSSYIDDYYGYQISHEASCSLIPVNPNTGRNMPFDNDVLLPNGKHLIIEVHGQQHYSITLFTNMAAKKKGITPEEQLKYQQWKDAYKKQYALNNGYYYLEIPYTAERHDQYQTLIDTKISEILSNNNTT